MKQTFLQKIMLILLLLTISYTASSKETIYKGTITINVGEEKTLYQTLDGVYVASWFIRQKVGMGWTDFQENWCLKIVSQDSYKCTIKGVAAEDEGIHEIHCISKDQQQECYWKVIVKAPGYIYVDANPDGGYSFSPKKVSRGTKVYLTARVNDTTVSDAKIYYTTDGSTPSQKSKLYTSAGITINEWTYLQAIAYKDSYSPVTSGWYYDIEEPKEDTILVTKITLNASSATLNVGDTTQLTATITPSNATIKTVIWQSMSGSVATVSSTGLVTAKATGSAIIKCTAFDGSGVSAECNVTVTDPDPDPITDISKLDNAIYTTPCSGMADSEVSLSINLKNKQSTCAYNFDIELPDGVSLATNDKGRYKYEKSSRHDDSHSVSINYNSANGLYSFGVLSVSSEELTGNDGTILTIWLKIPASMKDGIYAIKIKNAKYSLVTGATSVSMPETASTLTIESYKKGDVNNDGTVDIADAVCIVNHIVGKSVPVFIEAAAHVNNDGVIDIADAVRIVNLVVGKISSLSRQTGNAPKSVVRKTSVQNSIKANDIQFQSDLDTEASLEVNFQFDEEGVYSGYSFNIDLPSDFEFVIGKGTNVAYTKGDCHDESHSVTANLSEGLAKVACLSLSSEPLYGTAGKLLTFTIRPTKKLVTGSTYTGTIKDIIIVKENGEKKVLPSTTFTITFSGQTIKGDVNGDGKVNGTDLVTLARMILDMDSKNNAADVNGDGKVNGTDYTALVNIIMGRSAGVRGTANEATALAVALQIEPFAISAGETKEVVISLTNKDAALTLLQFDMQLPKGLSVAESEGSYLMAMGGRTNRDTHQLAAYGNTERMRFLLASGSNELIEGTEGAVIRMNVKATEDFEGGIITLNDILGVTPDEVEVWMPTSNYILTSNGTTGIYGIVTTVGEPAIYGLSGQRQATLKKGVNIVDGKKVIKK